MAYQIALNYFTGALQLVNASTGTGVTSLNDLTGALTLAAGSGVSIVESGGNTITVSFTGSGSGNVTGVPPTTVGAIAVWDNTLATLIQNSLTNVQTSGAIEAQAFITRRSVTSNVTVNFGETWISPSIELASTGSITLMSGGDIIMV